MKIPALHWLALLLLSEPVAQQSLQPTANPPRYVHLTLHLPRLPSAPQLQPNTLPSGYYGTAVYPTTLEQDLQALYRSPGGAAVPNAVLRYRYERKKLLAIALDMLERYCSCK